MAREIKEVIEAFLRNDLDLRKLYCLTMTENFFFYYRLSLKFYQFWEIPCLFRSNFRYYPNPYSYSCFSS